MSGKVVFYQLGQKFLERKEDVPAEARQVVYYSLAIGHHLGVIDCLKPILDIPLADYEAWLAQFAEGAARSKLEGLVRFGEITIDATHVALLETALESAAPAFDMAQAAWAASLRQALHAIAAEPAIYLIARKRD